MSDPITRVTLFVPGTPRSAKAWSAKLGVEGLRLPGPVEVEWIENDGEFGKAFSFGTVAPAAVAKIDAAPGALVLQWTIDLRDGRGQIVGAVERLRDAGALAVRVEQSKLGWEVSRWLELFGSDAALAWHRGAIAFLHGDRAMQSCGMHAFSLPDVRIVLDGDPGELQELASMLDLYQLAEDPVIRSGETFAPDRETPRRVIERWPDTEYPPGHACHNPYGVWRLGPPGGTARSLGDLVLGVRAGADQEAGRGRATAARPRATTSGCASSRTRVGAAGPRALTRGKPLVRRLADQEAGRGRRATSAARASR